MKVLIIEDNIQLGSNIVRFLSLHDVQAKVIEDGKKGLSNFFTHHYDIVILDMNLPSMGGKEILQKIREKQKNTPILFLTSNSSKDDIIEGLRLGADDYMTKPFDLDELLARLHALYRRNLSTKSNIIPFGEGYILDIEKSKVTYKDQEIKLSSLEYNLVKYLLQNRGKTLSREDIYNNVWGEFSGDIMFSKTIDVYIGYLRKKLSFDLIQTVKGIGYKM